MLLLLEGHLVIVGWRRSPGEHFPNQQSWNSGPLCISRQPAKKTMEFSARVILGDSRFNKGQSCFSLVISQGGHMPPPCTSSLLTYMAIEPFSCHTHLQPLKEHHETAGRVCIQIGWLASHRMLLDYIHRAHCLHAHSPGLEE